MTVPFLKNVGYASAGTIYRLLISFVALAVYIRGIGVEGYALVGITLSFFSIVALIDMPFFLTLIKHNKAHAGRQKFVKVFNTLYSTVTLSNILLFPTILVIVNYASKNIYQYSGIQLFYFIALLTYLTQRVIRYFQEFLRASGHEIEIQRAMVTALTVGFLTVITLMFLFKFGVLSIFVGTLVSALIEYLVLTRSIKRLVKITHTFSITLLFDTLRQYTFRNHLAKLHSGLLIYGGLLVSTFYLGSTSLGMLTIFVTFMAIIAQLFNSLDFHLAPILSRLAMSKNFRAIRSILKDTTYLMLFLFLLETVFLLTIARPLYAMYFSNQLLNTYSIFLVFIAGQLFYIVFTAQKDHLFVNNIKLYNKINLISIIFSFSAWLVLTPLYGLLGVATAYLLNFSLLALILLAYHFHLSEEPITSSNLCLVLVPSLTFLAIIFLGRHMVMGILLATAVFISVATPLFYIERKRIVAALTNLKITAPH